jgi:type IV secretion system protein VirB4
VRITETRKYVKGLPDLLLYDSLIDNGILLLQDGALLAAWKFNGPDMASATHGEMSTLSARLGAILKLGSGWMIHCDAIRSFAPDYPSGGFFPDPVTTLIDTERRQQFEMEGAHFESEYFVALTYLPAHQVEEKVKGWMFSGEVENKAPAGRALDYFKSKIAHFNEIFTSLFRAHRLRSAVGSDEQGYPFEHDELLRYIRRCISGADHIFSRPEFPVYLNEVIACEDLTAGIAPRLGKKHLRVAALDGFPRASHPGILGALDALPLEYRWSTRAILLDPQEAGAFLDKTRKKWRSKMRGWKDQLFQSRSGAVDYFAAEMAADAEAAMAAANSGDVLFAQYTTVIVLMDEDPYRLEDNIGLVKKTIQNIGFSCREETINCMEAWRGSLPGDGYANVRRIVLHTLNLADMLPITSIWAGQNENPSPLMPPKSPALLYGATTGATPFRFNLHVGDLGHTLMVGPPGMGKSTALALIAAQWFRYPNARVFAFDKGYSMYVLNRATGGAFYDIGGSKTLLSFCPLRVLETNEDVSWAVEYVEHLCVLNGLDVTPGHRNSIVQAVKLLRESPRRTLTDLVATVQNMEIRQALDYFTISGSLGSLLDAEEDSLGSSHFMVFEMDNLLGYSEKAVSAVLLYLFRRIEKRLTGAPTLVIMDEAWVALRNDLFREKLRDWLKTARKNNGVVIMATQNLSDIYNSPIKDVVLESCPTKILLANAEAGNPASRTFYESIGLNEREIEIIQTALPKLHYYVTTPLGRRLISLGIGKVALSFVGVSGAEERGAAEQVMEQNPESWQSEWLRKRGQNDWANWYDNQQLRLAVAERG